MKSPYQAAINKVLETIERLDPPCTIEFRSAGAFPTIVEIVPDNRGVDYSVDVGFAIEPEGASPALTAETAARVLSARSQSLEGVNASKQKLAEAWARVRHQHRALHTPEPAAPHGQGADSNSV
jgi:hypothetical protein